MLAATPCAAQLVETNQIGLRMGHVHLSVTDVDAQKRFWITVMGGTLVTWAARAVQFTGVYIMLREVEQAVPPPAGGIINHVGFIVQDMPKALAAWKAANVEIEPTEIRTRSTCWRPTAFASRSTASRHYATPISDEPRALLSGRHPGDQATGKCAWVRRQPGAPAVRRLPVEAADDRDRRSAGREPVVLAGAARRAEARTQQGTGDRSHRLRRAGSRRADSQPRGQGR